MSRTYQEICTSKNSDNEFSAEYSDSLETDNFPLEKVFSFIKSDDKKEYLDEFLRLKVVNIKHVLHF
jgi:hypothetical protein